MKQRKKIEKVINYAIVFQNHINLNLKNFAFDFFRFY